MPRIGTVVQKVRPDRKAGLQEIVQEIEFWLYYPIAYARTSIRPR